MTSRISVEAEDQTRGLELFHIRGPPTTLYEYLPSIIQLYSEHSITPDPQLGPQGKANETQSLT